MKKLKDPQEPLARLFERARLLGPKLGPILYQLPPRWRFDAGAPCHVPGRAARRAPAHHRGPRSQLAKRCVLRRCWSSAQVAFCIASLPQYEMSAASSPRRSSTIRFHGSRTMYYYDYLADELRYWRDQILRFAARRATRSIATSTTTRKAGPSVTPWN